MFHQKISLIPHVSYDGPDVPMDLAEERKKENRVWNNERILTSPISANDLGSVIKIRSSSLIGCEIQLTMGSSMEEVDITVDVVLWLGWVNDQHGSSYFTLQEDHSLKFP